MKKPAFVSLFNKGQPWLVVESLWSIPTLGKSTTLLCPLLCWRCYSSYSMSVLTNDQDWQILEKRPSSMSDPNIYLGVKMRYNQTTNGVWTWSMSSSKYTHEAVDTPCVKCEEPGWGLWWEAFFAQVCSKPPVPLWVRSQPGHDWVPWIWTSLIYKTLIGVLRWIVELGRIDINTNVYLFAC